MTAPAGLADRRGFQLPTLSLRSPAVSAAVLGDVPD